MNKAKNHTRLWHPCYWPAWLVISMLWLLTRLPYRWQLKIGRLLGTLMFYCSRQARRTSIINLQLCFPELTELERYRLLKKNFASIGMGLLETAMAWWKTPDKALLHIQGWEYLQLCLAQNKPVLLLGAHFTTLEIIGRLLSLYLPFGVVYRRQKNPVLEWLNQRTLRHYARAIVREDIRGFIRCLKECTPLWYTPDVDAGSKNSLFIPFFNVTAATITSTSRLAKLTDALVIPLAYYRREDGSGYDLIFYPPLSGFPSNDTANDTLRINQIVEAMIKEKPEQYLWQYKRFKTRPAGEARLYGKKAQSLPSN